jgi:hypothetical protein
MFWSGGFVFYAAVVVPIGTEVLGGPTQQGFITRHVAERINWAGAAALIPFAWDACTRDRRWRRRLRLLLIGVMFVCLAILLRLHSQMQILMPEDMNSALVDYDRFDTLHRLYLWTITAQWSASVGFMILSIAAWRGQDLTTLSASKAPL